MREYLVTVLLAAIITYLITPLVRDLAIKSGAVAAIRSRDVHIEPTPRWGGLAMWFAMAITLVIANYLPLINKSFGRETIVERYLPGADYRLLVVGNRLSAAARREPAQVVGDGTHTVAELVEIENKNPLGDRGLIFSGIEVLIVYPSVGYTTIYKNKKRSPKTPF